MSVVLYSPRSWAAAPSAIKIEEIITQKLTGELLTKEGEVSFQAPQKTEAPARPPQPLGYGDAVRTHALGRASVELQDLSDLRLKELTRLQILPRTDASNAPGLQLFEGQVYVSSRGGPVAIPIQTPHVAGVPKGTEFLVAVDPAANRTEFTMFDGEVELRNAANPQPVRVRRGEQGIAVPGQPIEVRAVIQAQNIVQWWLYYPGILDPEELGLTPAEQTQLNASLNAYRNGDLQEALKQYPGYPAAPDPDSESKRLYYAGLLLAVGAVDRAESQLSQANSNAPLAIALRTMISAVGASVSRLTSSNPKSEIRNLKSDRTASEWLALSYAQQSTHDLKGALKSAGAAVERSPKFGFGWARVAELEFSFARTRAAREAIQQALVFAPRNSQAHALSGFLLAADNRIKDALASFEEAIRLDPALGNAWLGRGLCKRRLGSFARGERSSLAPRGTSGERAEVRGNSQPDWLSDLRTAAILEPTRSLVRSYAAKAFGDVGDGRLAHKELNYAIHLDPNDPTPWLYSALLNRDENRINEAVRDLEQSIEKNDNRAVYRSRLLLDQDRAVRGANLANIYQDAGMTDVAFREAVRSVNADYANYSAHLFLSDSYNSLRDPGPINLRYETVAFSELLMANLLAPSGAGVLSPYVSQQEYSRLFEHDGLGLFSSTEYRSSGDWLQRGSQYGTIRDFSYALDVGYRSQAGQRPNNDLSQFTFTGSFKQQLRAQDSLWLQAAYLDLESGDLRQYYDQSRASSALRIKETQEPNLFAGYHHEWSSGIHTLMLAGRLQDDFRLSDLGVFTPTVKVGRFGSREVLFPQSLFARRQRAEFTAYSAELQQVWRGAGHTLIGGARYQDGRTDSVAAQEFLEPPSSVSELEYEGGAQHTSTDLRRLSVYGYHTWEIVPSFRLTIGLSYDRLHYPENIDLPPITDRQLNKDQLSPKVGLVWTPTKATAVRAAYTRSLGGLYYDASVRLEPTQLAGFNQAFRSLIPESIGGLAAGTQFDTWGVALEHRFESGTYLGVAGHLLQSQADQTVGTFEFACRGFCATNAFRSDTPQRLVFREKSLSVALNQLLGREWSLGARYQVSVADLDVRLLELDQGVALESFPDAAIDNSATLQQLTLSADFNHPSGFFARFESLWTHQSNRGYGIGRPGDPGYRPEWAGEDFWQFNALAGYRFARRRAEAVVGLLNLTGRDYQLNPLNLHAELPRERTLLVSFRFSF